MADERYEFDVNEGVEKRENKLKQANKNRILYILLFVVFIIIHTVVARS